MNRICIDLSGCDVSPLPSATSSPSPAGSVVGGSWLVLRACTEASPSLLATLASTLLLMHRARTHDTATPVIPIAGQESAVHPGVAVILCGSEASIQARGKAPALPHSLDTLCRPIRVSAPPPRTLVFAWLLAHDVPKAQRNPPPFASPPSRVPQESLKSPSRVPLESLKSPSESLRVLRVLKSPSESLKSPQSPSRVPLNPAGGERGRGGGDAAGAGVVPRARETGAASAPAGHQGGRVRWPPSSPKPSRRSRPPSPPSGWECWLRQVMLPRLPIASRPNVASVLDLLSPVPVATPPSPSSIDEDFHGKTQAEKILQKMGLRIFSQQAEAAEGVARGAREWGCVVVRGPPRSGKTTVITVAGRLLQHALADRGAPVSTRRSQPPSGSNRDDASVSDTADGLDIEVLHANRQLPDRQVYTIRPQSYDQTTLLGSSSQDGLLPRLLERLTAAQSHSVVILEGPGAADCLLRLHDLPGTLLLESLKAVRIGHNITFVVEAREDEPLPAWVLGRSCVVQLDPAVLSAASILPVPALTPPPPLSDRHSHSSATPRSSSKPSTPRPVDSARSQADESEATPAMLMEYLVHRLLQPVLDVAAGQFGFRLAAVDLIRQIEELLGGSLTSLGAGEELTAGEVARVVEALVQGTRAQLDVSLLPELLLALKAALKQVTADGILQGGCMDAFPCPNSRPSPAPDLLSLAVVQSLASYGGPVVDCCWDAASSVWSPWTPAPPVEEGADAHVRPTLEISRLQWFFQRVMKSGLPLAVAGPPSSGKSTTVMAVLASLGGWTPVIVRVTPTTTPEDLEEMVFSRVTRTSYDTLAPDSPVVLCFDDLGCLPVGGRTESYVRALAFHGGVYTRGERVRWTELVDVYIVGVCTRQGNQAEGGLDLSGWVVYNMGLDESSCSSAVSAALTPIAALQSQITEAVTTTTETLAKRVTKLPGLNEEPFGPANAQAILWHVAAFLADLFRNPSSLASSSSTGMFVLRAWLHMIAVRVYHPIHSVRMRERVWSEIQACVNEGCGAVLGEAPPELPLSLWPPSVDPHDPSNPEFAAEEEVAASISRTLESKSTDGAAHGHRGVAVGVALVVDVLHALLHARTANATPFLLLIGPPSKDKDIVVNLAVSYLGIELTTVAAAEGALAALRESEGSEQGEGGKEASSLRLVYIPASLLRGREVLDAVLRLTSGPLLNVKNKKVVLVAGSREEVWPLQKDLATVARHGRVVCLPAHTAAHHEAFLTKLLQEKEALKGENESTCSQVAEFMAYVHKSYCDTPAGGTLSGAPPRSSKGFSQPQKQQLPSVVAMEDLVTTFVKRLKDRKEHMQKKLRDLRTAVGRVGELEGHVTSLKTTNTCLETTLEEAAAEIAKIKENLEDRESNIETHEKGVAELRAEAARVERAAQELNGEVEEYVTETKAPLVEITNSLAELDILRIRKLLSRSPISAIQVVFECAVSLMSNQDVTWRAVRHATQDDTFCTKIAAICVPSLKQAQIVSLTEKLEQIKMTPEHLSRVSDIGGILLQYLRTAIFFWHRYHEDVQPRQERVQELKDQCTQLQVEMATKERLIRGAREEVAKLTARLKDEEGRVVTLKRQKIDVEEELANVLAVITELQPHAESWRRKIKEQEDMLTQLTGKCLLEASRLTYLSALPPGPRSALAGVWEADLVSRGLLAPQQPQPQRGLRLVLRAGELQQDVDEALQHHANRAPLLLLRDPHHLVEEYVRGGVWVNVESGSWREALVERLAVTPRTPLYLRLQHAATLEVVACTQKLLQGECHGKRKERTTMGRGRTR
nr:uncharacterized protein LOC113816833 [Penaeus vannamei]